MLSRRAILGATTIAAPFLLSDRLRAAATKKVRLLRLVGLEGFGNHKPHQLSGGMRQPAAIGRALVYDPEVPLMDEPISALDTATRDEMNEALVDIWSRYIKTAPFVTYPIRKAVYLVDRVLVMNRQPATVVADFAIPPARSRDPAVGERKMFNELRGMIEHSHRAAKVPAGA